MTGGEGWLFDGGRGVVPPRIALSRARGGSIRRDLERPGRCRASESSPIAAAIEEGLYSICFHIIKNQKSSIYVHRYWFHRYFHGPWKGLPSGSQPCADGPRLLPCPPTLRGSRGKGARARGQQPVGRRPAKAGVASLRVLARAGPVTARTSPRRRTRVFLCVYEAVFHLCCSALVVIDLIRESDGSDGQSLLVCFAIRTAHNAAHFN